MLHIGCHLSSSKGFAAMGETARGIKADTFAFFRFFVKCWGAPQLNRLLGTRQGICRVPFLPIHIENPVPKSVEITHSKCNSLNRLNQVVTAFCESIGVWLDNCLNNCSLPIFKRS